ncbi:MAG: DEAD/DEAH box helicase [Streptococcaceae bacterium]|jgi:ATP-dependent RNA helicase CshB|nr:DEAD/DEAH box helicase [Streptococcaceae bacterium]
MTFQDYQLKAYIMETLSDIGFFEPTAAQERMIPTVLAGRDLVGESKTGSGKTHAFLLPIMQGLDLNKEEVQAVITAPSRELATQIFEAARAFEKHEARLSVSLFVGGTDKARQAHKLGASGQPMLVIGTPGRILDLVKSESLKIHTARTFVVDEADMTLDMGFLQEVDDIAGRLGERVQTLVFSATIPQKLQPFLKKYLHQPVMETLASKTVIAESIDNWLISTKGASRNDLILQLTRVLNPYVAMIFANTKERVDAIADFLRSNGLKVAKIHGGVPPRERKRVMAGIQRLDYQYVVATDIAARGIDIEGVSHVINDEIPSDLSFFVHRVGRTGRNGLSGTAITLYAPSDDAAIREIEKMGVVFKPKVLKGGELVDTYDRDRREKRTKSRDELSTTARGLLAKGKKKVKPGYKRNIGWVVAEENKKRRRAEKTKTARKKRQARKDSNS